VNQELIVRSHEHAIVTALQESKVDQLGDIRVHVLVVTPQGLGELANIKPLVRRNVA
jgi:cysteine sulfinate desulfinase/cysteine desulfurase-like protein